MALNPIKYSHFWNSIISFPPVKRMLLLSLKKCGKCGNQVIESALNKYIGSDAGECEGCRLYSNVIIFWIEFLRRSLKIERRKVEKLLADNYVRRGIKSIINTFIHFGIKKPLTTYAPFLVVWDYTYRCNLKCRHCYSNAGKSSQEMTTEEALNVVDQLADFGVVALAFSGGEPLMRKDFFEVAKHAADCGLYVSLATNGTLIGKSTAKKLKDIGVHYVEISLDGSCAKTHDTFRGFDGAFEMALRGLKNCIEQNLCTSIATTLTKMNLREIPEILELAEKIGVNRFTLFNFIPTGRGEEIVLQDVSPKEREEIMLFMLNKLLTGCKVTILTTIPQLARVAVTYQNPEGEVFIPMAHMQTTKVSGRALALADFIGGCGAGRLYCAIEPNGDVKPCVFIPIVVGNVKNEEFRDIWLNSDLFNALRNRENLKGACGKCEFKYICGGCRARALAYNHDILAPDPGCIIVEQEFSK